MPEEPVYEVVWPSSPVHRRVYEPAPRVGETHGLRVGFVSDGYFRADEMMAAIGESLRRHHGEITSVGPDTFGYTHAAHEHEVLEGLPARLAEEECELVISGVGA